MILGLLCQMASGEVRYPATETAGGFTGVFLGMYATGNGSATLTPAYFGYFDYVVLPENNAK